MTLVENIYRSERENETRHALYILKTQDSIPYTPYFQFNKKNFYSIKISFLNTTESPKTECDQKIIPTIHATKLEILVFTFIWPAVHGSTQDTMPTTLLSKIIGPPTSPEMEAIVENKD